MKKSIILALAVIAMVTLAVLGVVRHQRAEQVKRNKTETARKILIGSLANETRNMPDSDPDKKEFTKILAGLENKTLDPLHLPAAQKQTLCGHVWKCCDSGSWQCCAGGWVVCGWWSD